MGVGSGVGLWASKNSGGKEIKSSRKREATNNKTQINLDRPERASLSKGDLGRREISSTACKAWPIGTFTTLNG